MEFTPTVPLSTDQDKSAQISYLCLLLVSINEVYKTKDNVIYASGDLGGATPLAPYPNFLHMLAKICSSRKGGDTETSLIPLKKPDGPEYNIVSNTKKATESAKQFLTSLLKYVGENPDELKDKALQKKILWLILEFNFPRIDIYLTKLLQALDDCIRGCNLWGDKDDADIRKHLHQLQRKAQFSRDMSASSNARSKFLSDCEALIKAIQSSKGNECDVLIDNRASETILEQSLPWCQLRHHLGRLYSFRQAAESILQASKEWSPLFKSFTVRCIASSQPTKAPISRAACSIKDILQKAFPGFDLRRFQADIEYLEKFDLDAKIQAQLEKIPRKTIVHCENVLHDDLVRRGKTEPADFWNETKFIATSKPPCRLCHFYFENSDNEFDVQSSHMNIYLKWRLPDFDESQGLEAKERYDEAVDDIIQHLQRDVFQTLRKKATMGRNHDSRTDSGGGRTTAGMYTASERSAGQSDMSISRMSKFLRIGRHGEPVTPEEAEEEGWDYIPEENEDDAV